MLLAVVLLLLGIFGLVPLSIALPLAGGSAVLGIGSLTLLQRRMSRVPIATGYEAMVGQITTTLTPVERDGRIRIGSETWAARAQQGAIPAGQRVEVVGFAGLRAIVRAVDSHHCG